MIFTGSPHKTITLSVILLVTIGLVFIYSVSGPHCLEHGQSPWYYFVRQLIFAIIAFAVLLVISRIDYHKILQFAPIIMFFALALLVVVLFAPTKQKVNRWIDIGFLQIQPSEIFKLALVMYSSYTIGKLYSKKLEPIKLIPRLVMLVVGLLLIFKQPDLGTLAAVFLITAAILFLAGLKVRYLAVVALVVLIFGSAIVFIGNYEKDRITDYIAFLKDPLGNHQRPGLGGGYYQAKQSLISIGSGGILGRGLGEGGQKNLFMPAPHTDFIFASSAEEGGMILCLSVLVLFVTFFFSTVEIAARAVDVEGFLLASGLGILITTQAVVNIGVALGLLPITGITLPFFSYGGSSLVVSCAAVGLILSVNRHGCGYWLKGAIAR